MNYQLLMTDMDDTLLNNKHELSQENIKAIKQLQEQGYYFVLASGRPTGGMYQVAQQLMTNKQDEYMVSFNGGRIENLYTNEVIFEATIPHQNFRQLVSFAQKNQVVISSYTKDAIVATGKNEYVELESTLTGLPIEIVDDIVDYFIDKPIPKSIIFAESEKIKKLKPELLDVMGDTVEVTISKPVFLEVMPLNVNKGNALKKLSEYLNIPLAATVAVGDGENDLQMIDMAAVGVAVANACDLLKEAADFVTVSNNDDVLATVIERFFK